MHPPSLVTSPLPQTWKRTHAATPREPVHANTILVCGKFTNADTAIRNPGRGMQGKVLSGNGFLCGIIEHAETSRATLRSLDVNQGLSNETARRRPRVTNQESVRTFHPGLRDKPLGVEPNRGVLWAPGVGQALGNKTLRRELAVRQSGVGQDLPPGTVKLEAKHSECNREGRRRHPPTEIGRKDGLTEGSEAHSGQAVEWYERRAVFWRKTGSFHFGCHLLRGLSGWRLLCRGDVVYATGWLGGSSATEVSWVLSPPLAVAPAAARRGGGDHSFGNIWIGLQLGGGEGGERQGEPLGGDLEVVSAASHGVLCGSCQREEGHLTSLGGHSLRASWWSGLPSHDRVGKGIYLAPQQDGGDRAHGVHVQQAASTWCVSELEAQLCFARWRPQASFAPVELPPSSAICQHRAHSVTSVPCLTWRDRRRWWCGARGPLMWDLWWRLRCSSEVAAESLASETQRRSGEQNSRFVARAPRLGGSSQGGQMAARSPVARSHKTTIASSLGLHYKHRRQRELHIRRRFFARSKILLPRALMWNGNMMRLLTSFSLAHSSNAEGHVTTLSSQRHIEGSTHAERHKHQIRLSFELQWEVFTETKRILCLACLSKPATDFTKTGPRQHPNKHRRSQRGAESRFRHLSPQSPQRKAAEHFSRHHSDNFTVHRCAFSLGFDPKQKKRTPFMPNRFRQSDRKLEQAQ
ncbi:hypothetical protein Q7P37_002342 [Cladosporium fusiforme]